MLFRDIEGRVLSRVEFVYDESGRLIEEAQTNAEETLPQEVLAQMNPAQLQTMRGVFGVGEPFRRMHRYDSKGRRIETCSQLAVFGTDRKTTDYDEHGEPIQEKFEHESREFGIDDEGRFSNSPTKETVNHREARFHYAYDAHGNWVRKVVEGSDGAKHDFTISAIEQRTLVYYDETPNS